MPPLDPAVLRPQFPALAMEQGGRPVVFLDGPGGTQVPRRVIDAVAAYYRESNANHGGAFVTSLRSDEMLDEAHAAIADLLGAASPDEIKFGANMTTLTFALGRAVGRTLRQGDEVVVTRLDHEANRGPWISAAADAGAVVREIAVDPRTCTLDPSSLDAAITPRTRLVAVGYAANAVGTVNPVGEIVRRAHEVGAWAFVDAVHYAPHGPIDVVALDADFFACSAYKFFGPHVGVLYGRRALLDELPAYKVRPAEDRWETGTQNHEGIAGTLAAVEYLAEVGVDFGATTPHHGRRERLVAGMRAIAAHERELSLQALAGLATIPGLHLHGIADASRIAERTPTFAITLDGWTPRGLAEALAAEGIFAWDGDFYATALVEDLGLAPTGGVVRLGLVHYSTSDEVDRLMATLARLADAGPAGA